MAHNRIHSQNVDAIEWALSKKPEINYVDDEGFIPLTSALQIEEDSRTFHRLNADGTVQSLDQASAEHLTIRVIDMLLDAGADIKLGGCLAETALHAAAMRSSPGIVRHLLQRGADPMARDQEYTPQQPVNYAKFFKRWEVYDILCDAMRTKDGHSQ